MTKADFERTVGGVCGLGGGGIKFTTLQMNPLVHHEFWETLIPAAITAVVCAILGLVAADLYRWTKKKIFKPKL